MGKSQREKLARKQMCDYCESFENSQKIFDATLALYGVRLDPRLVHAAAILCDECGVVRRINFYGFTSEERTRLDNLIAMSTRCFREGRPWSDELHRLWAELQAEHAGRSVASYGGAYRAAEVARAQYLAAWIERRADGAAGANQ